MPHRLAWDSPIRTDRILDIDFDPIDREIQHLTFAHSKIVAKKDLDLGADVGLLCLFNLDQGKAIRSGRINHFVDGAPQ